MVVKFAIVLFASVCLAFPSPDEELGPRPDKIAVPSVPRISNYIPYDIAEGQLQVPAQTSSAGEDAGTIDLDTANSRWHTYSNPIRRYSYYNPPNMPYYRRG